MTIAHSARVQADGLQVAQVLHDLVAHDIAPATGLSSDKFWRELESIIDELAQRLDRTTATFSST